MKKFIIAASLAATTAIAVPVLALPGGAERGGQTMTRAQVQAKVQERFTAMDTNRDGAVTKAEYDANRAKMQADREAKRTERRGEMFAKLDANKDGQISKAEFTARPERGDRRGGPDGKRGGPDGPGGKHMRGHGGPGGGHGMGGWGGWGGPKGDERAAAFFASMDANKDGKVTLAEASATPLAMFDKADANKDGTVTPEERRAAWTAMRAAR